MQSIEKHVKASDKLKENHNRGQIRLDGHSKLI